MSERPCPDCGGKRLRKEALAVTVGGISIHDFCQMSVTQALDFVGGLELPPEAAHRRAHPQGDQEPAWAFSSRWGSSTSPQPGRRDPLWRREPAHPPGHPDRLLPHGGPLYPGRALHRPPPAGQRQLLATLKRLRDLGNTLLVVEHDEDNHARSGLYRGYRPRAGVHGGEVALRHGREVMNTPGSITGDYLSGGGRSLSKRSAGRAAENFSPSGARRRTTCGTWTCPSPGDLSPASPACPAPASPSWSMRSSTKSWGPISTG